MSIVLLSVAIVWPIGFVAAAQTTSVPAPQQPRATADPSAIGPGLLDQQRRVVPPAESTPNPVTGDAAPAAPDEPTGAEGVRFVLRRVTFDASRFLPEDELQTLAAPLIGRDVSFSDLGKVVRQVNALYAKRGVVTARAYLPPQQIDGGIVRVALVEGRLGALDVGDGRYTSANYARSQLSMKQGEVIDLARMRARIAGFNRLNDVQLRARLQPGSDVGLTDVIISISEPARNGIQAYLDTYGYQSTGRYQGGLVLRRSDLLADGDRATLFGSGSSGSFVGSASYNVSLWDARASLSYARSQISVTRGPSAALDIKGVSNIGSMNIAKPIAGGSHWSLLGTAAAAYIASNNKVAGRTASTTKVLKGTLGTSLQLELGGATTAILSETVNFVHSDDSLDPAKHSFAIYNADASIITPLGSRVSARLLAAGQYSGSDFVPSNQIFQIGGPGSVRGYQPGASSGRSGFFGQFELHWQPLPTRQIELFGFADGGKTYSPDFGNRQLATVGVGLHVPVWRFALDATMGAPITNRLPREDRVRADLRLSVAL